MRPAEPFDRRLLRIGLGLELGLILLALGSKRMLGTGALRWGAPVPALEWAAAGAAPVLAFAFAALSDRGLALRPFARIAADLREALGSALIDWSVPRMLALSAAAGFAEELLFRGVLQTRLGLSAASLLFGLMHAMSLPYFVVAAAMGFYLGGLYQASGSLLAPILVHAAYDAAALWLLRRRFRREAAGDRTPTS